MQRRRRALVVGERQVEEFVDRRRPPRGRAAPACGAHAVLVEQVGEELERRHRSRPRARQRFSVSAALSIARRWSRRAVEQRLPQRTLALRRERQEVVVVETEQRAFQHGWQAPGRPPAASGNRRARSGPARRSDRSAQPVGAGDSECRAPSVPRPSAPANGATLAHEDQDVAGADRAVLRTSAARRCRASA